MGRIDIRGLLIPNDYKIYYDYFQQDSTCPRDVQKIINASPNEIHDVYINSPGGVIDVGSEIYTMIRAYQPGVNIHVVGEACSAASMVAMAGKCDMSPTALIMVHCVSTSVGGNHSVMEQTAEVLRTADMAICQAYMQKSGMSEKEALAMMEKETWLTAQMALERGLIDGIMFENTAPAAMTAAAGIKLPTVDQMNMIKNLVDTNNKDLDQAFIVNAKLNLLKMRGAKR